MPAEWNEDGFVPLNLEPVARQLNAAIAQRDTKESIMPDPRDSEHNTPDQKNQGLGTQTELDKHQDKQAQQGQNPEKKDQQSATPEKDRHLGKPQRDEDEDPDAKRARENLDNPTPRN